MADSSSHWIQGAIKHPGAFTRKAKAHHLSVSRYAAQVKSGKSKADATTKRQATLAQTLSKLRGGRMDAEDKIDGGVDEDTENS